MKLGKEILKMLDSLYLTATTVVTDQGIVRAVTALPEGFQGVFRTQVTGYFGGDQEVTISSLYLGYEFGVDGEYIAISHGPASDAVMTAKAVFYYADREQGLEVYAALRKCQHDRPQPRDVSW